MSAVILESKLKVKVLRTDKILILKLVNHSTSARGLHAFQFILHEDFGLTAPAVLSTKNPA